MNTRGFVGGTPLSAAGVTGWVADGAPTRINDGSFSVADNAANQAIYIPGRPIRYKATAGTWRYGIIVEYVAGTVSLAGAPMTLADDDVIQWSAILRTIREQIVIRGRWADGATVTLLEEDLGLANGLQWPHGPAYLVRISGISMVDDTGANQPRCNVYITGNPVCTDNVNEGPQIVDGALTDSGYAIDNANYSISFGDTYEVSTDAHGTNNNSVDLKLELIWIKA